jgi:8-oxo-dGTP pyrophosphatase MutT (NUDIX family)
MIMGEKKPKQGAGFIIFNKNDRSKMLVLVRQDGVYDIPKGVKNKGESDLSAAKRECFEECSIVIENNELLPCAPLRVGALITFSAETSKTPDIVPNEETGIWEHVSWSWVSQKEAIAKCIPYLKPLISNTFRQVQMLSTLEIE